MAKKVRIEVREEVREEEGEDFSKWSDEDCKACQPVFFEFEGKEYELEDQTVTQEYQQGGSCIKCKKAAEITKHLVEVISISDENGILIEDPVIIQKINDDKDVKEFLSNTWAEEIYCDQTLCEECFQKEIKKVEEEYDQALKIKPLLEEEDMKIKEEFLDRREVRE